MSACDYVKIRDVEEHGLIQVKCWTCEMVTYSLTDTVPTIDLFATYSVALREGGYLNVAEQILQDHTCEPRYTPVFDKWGDRFDPNKTKGILASIMPDPYLTNVSRKPRTP